MNSRSRRRRGIGMGISHNILHDGIGNYNYCTVKQHMGDPKVCKDINHVASSLPVVGIWSHGKLKFNEF